MLTQKTKKVKSLCTFHPRESTPDQALLIDRTVALTRTIKHNKSTTDVVFTQADANGITVLY